MKPSFRPQLEALEARLTPTATVQPPSSAMLGNQSDLRMTVFGRAGNDSASFLAQGVGVSADLRFHFDGGDGSDAYAVFLAFPTGSDALALNATADLLFDGGKG